MPKNERAGRIEALDFDYGSQPKHLVAQCNLCGDSQWVRLSHTDRYGYAATARGCRRCGLVVINPVMSSEAYSRFYETTYRPLVSAYHGRLIDAQTVQDEQKLYARDLVDFLRPHLNSSHKTVLDIGGSTGIVAHHLRSVFGIEPTVIDPAPLEVEVALKLGIRTITALIEDYDPGEGKFDAVIICQSIDHFLDVASALEKVRTVIADHGIFFIDIVDLRAGLLRNWSLEGTIKVDHPYYLTEETMRAYLVRAGFEVVEVNYAADHLHVGFLCRPCAPDREALPTVESVERLFGEIRYVQNAPRPDGARA